MFFTFLILLSFIPIVVGVTLLILFKKYKLSRVLFLLLLMVTFWQLDVAFLYSYNLLSEEIILFLFKLLRFGSIMITPVFFHVGYTIVQEILPEEMQKKWKPYVNRTTLYLIYGLAFLVYIVGWSKNGVSSLELMQVGSNEFYFPVYGKLSWTFFYNNLFFLVSMTTCLMISLNVKQKSERSFLVCFSIFSTVGYAIGGLNMFPAAKLYPSSIALLVYSLSILIISSRMHLEMMNSMNKKLSEQKKFLFQVIDLNPNYIYARDRNDRYTLLNQSYAQLKGMNIQDMIGKTDDDLQGEPQLKNTIQGEHLYEAREKVFIREEEITSASGEVVWVQTVKVPINLNESSAILAVSTDITERKQYEDEIKFQAYHDSLTGLPNRRMFNEDLTNLLEKAKSENSQGAIMFLDLDRFKYINDTMGHDVGDLLLIEVSRRIENLLKKRHHSAKVYRLGGDEFTILLSQYDSTASEALAKELLEQFKTGFVIVDSEYFISPSIGISIFPKDGEDANTLIKNADTAMYYVKDKGKNNYQLFTAEMQKNFYRKMMIEKQLRTALDNNEFELYYQPIIHLKTNRIIAMESLLRWNNEILGSVPPDEFISVAEETGMILPIGHWVLQTAIQQHAKWLNEGYKPLKTSVNVSVRQLLDPMFVEYVKNAIESSGVDADNIVLEITESIAMYADSMIEKLNALKKIGVILSMDDFGTGYSSLSYLNKYPLDSLKIDKSFVMGMHQDEEHKAIVKTIIAIAKHLGLRVIAEGVEGLEDADYLNKMGCDYGQGYYFSRPISAIDIEEKWLLSKE